MARQRFPFSFPPQTSTLKPGMSPSDRLNLDCPRPGFVAALPLLSISSKHNLFCSGTALRRAHAVPASAEPQCSILAAAAVMTHVRAAGQLYGEQSA